MQKAAALSVSPRYPSSVQQSGQALTGAFSQVQATVCICHFTQDGFPNSAISKPDADQRTRSDGLLFKC